ncbi:MAG: tRNA-dihydrouridine synthase family protein [Polyangiaceae bacterium]
MPISALPERKLPSGAVPGQPLLALAPMQNVTDLAFMQVVAHYGAPDYFFTEYFRVHPRSRLEKPILRSIVENDTGRPVFAQLIGHDAELLTKAARELQDYPIAGVDLNLGCPAPYIYKQNVGGGLLRDPLRVGELLAALRAAIPGLFTVKMRIGFDSLSHFEALLEQVERHGVDLLSLHGRTVLEGYRSEVHYDAIAQAVLSVRCPVLANGNVTSADAALRVLATTRAAGVMIGRNAIRNPWIFSQCRARFDGRSPRCITLADVREYIERLYRTLYDATSTAELNVTRLKRYLNFVGTSVDPEGRFLFEMRRAASELELFRVCDRHLLSDPERPAAIEPYPGVLARPKCEDASTSAEPN